MAVPAGGIGGVEYGVTPRERGDALMGGVVLQWRGAWGLVERSGIAPLEQTVEGLSESAGGPARGAVSDSQPSDRRSRSGAPGASAPGREFDNLRDYRPGDERRDVCWSASARRGKLVTKVYQPERSQTVWLLVDAGRLLRARIGAADDARPDRHRGADAGAGGARLRRPRRTARLRAPAAAARRAGPRRRAICATLVDALALVHADGVEADHAAAAATVMAAQKRRALVVWLTDVADTAGVPDVIEQALRMSPAHVVLFGVMRQPEIAALAAAAPARRRTCFASWRRRKRSSAARSLLHGLRQHGALVLEVSPAELSSGLVDRYLEVKERGLL